MSRKFIVAIAAVAALGISTLGATDASARFGGGGMGGGGHFSGGGRIGGGHVTSFSRASFHQGRITTTRNVTRTIRPTHFSRVNRPIRPNPHHFHFARLHHGHHWWWWCRHHHHYRCGYTWIDVGVVGDVEPLVVDAPQAVAATPAASVCTNDCDYFLNDEPGCYMAKRAFSTPAGDELRCVKICEEPQHAAK